MKLAPVVKRSIPHKRSTLINRSAADKKHRPKKIHDHDFKYKCPAAEHLPTDVQACGVNITYACWKALYKLPDVIPELTAGNSLGLFEQGDYFAEADVDLYFKEFAPFVPQGTYPIPALIDGADFSEPQSNTALVGGEADIDIDIA